MNLKKYQNQFNKLFQRIESEILEMSDDELQALWIQTQQQSSDPFTISVINNAIHKWCELEMSPRKRRPQKKVGVQQ